MSDKKTQKTPKGHEIPVPTRKQVEDALEGELSPLALTP